MFARILYLPFLIRSGLTETMSADSLGHWLQIFFCVFEGKVTVCLIILFYASHYLHTYYTIHPIYLRILCFFFQLSGVIDKDTVSLYYLQLKISQHSVIVLDKAVTNSFFLQDFK